MGDVNHLILSVHSIYQQINNVVNKLTWLLGINLKMRISGSTLRFQTSTLTVAANSNH